MNIIVWLKGLFGDVTKNNSPAMTVRNGDEFVLPRATPASKLTTAQLGERSLVVCAGPQGHQSGAPWVQPPLTGSAALIRDPEH